MQVQTVQDLFEHEISDLFSAENQLVAALPKLAQAATNDELRQAFEHHLEETREHVRRLEDIRGQIRSTMSDECKGMKGLIEEGQEILTAGGDPDVKDAALIGAAQRVEHYEIAAYGTLIAYARQLGHEDAAELLEETLNEEKETDQKLTELAESILNVKAKTMAAGAGGGRTSSNKGSGRAR